MRDLPEVYPTPEDEPRFPWEEHPALRFTFLMHFTEEGDRAALEHLGRMLYDMALECSRRWPAWRESPTRTEMRAVARDLRHAESFLLSIADERHTVSLSTKDERFTFMAQEWSAMAGRIAQGIEWVLGPLYDRDGNVVS